MGLICSEIYSDTGCMSPEAVKNQHEDPPACQGLNPQPKTRAERAFQVERALPRTLRPRRNES